jgi:hypothetical protein
MHAVHKRLGQLWGTLHTIRARLTLFTVHLPLQAERAPTPDALSIAARSRPAAESARSA